MLKNVVLSLRKKFKIVCYYVQKKYLKSHILHQLSQKIPIKCKFIGKLKTNIVQETSWGTIHLRASQ